MRTKFVPAFLAILIAVFSVQAQDVSNVTLKVAVVDKDLNVKNVPKFLLTVAKKGNAFAEWKIATGFDGVAMMTLPAGEYVVRSNEALQFGGSEYTWDAAFSVSADAVTVVELSNDNAKVGAGSGAPKRRVSEAAELFKNQLGRNNFVFQDLLFRINIF